ncbi:MAG: hypothetical protein L0H84_05605 [Pseudonocardia sp.]|nr:hypothetical protein [Pseudonocardia sp.]
MAPAEVELVDDFDAFWAAKKEQQPHTRIRGVVVPIPMDLPLALIAQMQGATAADEDTNKAILAEVYSPDIIEQWINAGMGAREFFVVLTWSFVRGSGGQISFADAVERADEVMTKIGEDGGGAAGKAAAAKVKPKAKAGPNRATRRSAAAGGSSSRTSAANTASPRRTSPT